MIGRWSSHGYVLANTAFELRCVSSPFASQADRLLLSKGLFARAGIGYLGRYVVSKFPIRCIVSSLTVFIGVANGGVGAHSNFDSDGYPIFDDRTTVFWKVSGSSFVCRTT